MFIICKLLEYFICDIKLLCISIFPGAVAVYKGNQNEVTNPCKNNPCRDNEVCLIYRRKCRHSASCPHFVCRKGKHTNKS